MASRTEIFLAAKQAFISHPDWSDTQVAEYIGVSERDTPGLQTIIAARRDTEAGEQPGMPDLRRLP
jgi:hypothetical protein